MRTFKNISLLNYKPYFLIALSALIAFLPVSTMLFSLKNDIVMLDYPIKYFISQCIQHNIQPFWFNTWSKGFPLESIITWSYFSPLQFFFGTLFNYTLHTLHIEFLAYISLSGLTMFYFLKKHVSANQSLTTVIAICYMLSGFTVGSSQWMTYLTASAFLPIVLSSLISLLKTPSLEKSLLFAALYYIMLTSVYPAFTIITTYLLIGLIFYFLLKKWYSDVSYFTRTKIISSLIATLLLMLLLYSTSLFYSFNVLDNIERGKPLQSDELFNNSNYLHPKGLITLFFPFSSVRITAFNTEGTMMDSYIGLLPILLFPASIALNLKDRNFFNLLLLLLSIGFLLLAFGNLTPLRDFINVLPGFAYFRNPALFRLFFNFFILVYITNTFRFLELNSIKSNGLITKNLSITTILITVGSLLIILTGFYLQRQLPQNITSIKIFLHDLTFRDTLITSAGLQLLLLVSFSKFYKKNNFKILKFLLVSDLIINCLISTPFFTVSSHSVKETNRIFQSINGFPIQNVNPLNVNTSYHLNGASWYNINVYRKQVSALESNYGPLTLEGFIPSNNQIHNTFSDDFILFSLNNDVSLEILLQHPNKVTASIISSDSVDIYFQQNYYKGWHAYFNDKEIDITQIQGNMRVSVAGSGKLEFIYERTLVYIIATILNILILGILLYVLVKSIYKKSFLAN